MTNSSALSTTSIARKQSYRVRCGRNRMERKEEFIRRVFHMNSQEVCSLIFLLFGNIEKVVTLFDLGFSGLNLVSMIEFTFEFKQAAKARVSQHYQTVDLGLLEEIIDWIHNSITDPRKNFFPPDNVDLISFNILSHVDSKLNNLKSEYLISIREWDIKINETIAYQQSLLKDLFKRPILPDSYRGFEFGFEEWNYHFNDLKIPDNKVSDLISHLSNDARVGNGSGYSMITLIDSHSSGKTYSIFQLANTVPTGDYFDHFYVVSIDNETKLFKKLEELLREKQYSMRYLVSLFILAIQATVKNLIENVATLTPLNFLRFMRHEGDGRITSIFETLVARGKVSSFDSLNETTSRYIRESRIKLVFSFDNAEKLLEYTDDRNQSLLMYFYKELKYFNNPVFIGSSFTISKVELNVSTVGRRFIRPIIGSMKPCYFEDVERILSHMFNVEHFKEKFHLLCYLLSGSPDNISRFHIALLNLSKNSLFDPLLLIQMAIEEVVKYQEEKCMMKMNQYFKDKTVVDGMGPFLKLSLGYECKFDDPSLEIEQLCDISRNYSQSFIENGIAYVVKTIKGSRFEIVNPIIAKSYFSVAIREFLVKN